MPTAQTRLTTSVLLTCAAIGVATGVLGGVAGWLTPVVLATVPILYGIILGAHVLPGIIAQELIRLPWVALIAHVVAALVASAMAPQWAPRFIGTAILFGGIQELVAALTRYRVWSAWRFFISAIVIGGVVAVAVAFAAHLSTLRAVGPGRLPRRGRARTRRVDGGGSRRRVGAAPGRRRTQRSRAMTTTLRARARRRPLP